jgi:TatD DNase family protein
MFDSHCHLQDERIAGRVGDVIASADRAGVRRMLCCGSAEGDWADVARIGADYPESVTCAYGVHPWYVGKIVDDWDKKLEGYLASDPSAAVGEIGLDNAVDVRNDEAQAKIFIRQLEIARRYSRPVSIHCRKAWGSLLSILKDAGGLPAGGAIHSYSGPPDLVGELEKLGCYISFSGSILSGRPQGSPLPGCNNGQFPVGAGLAPALVGNKRAAESLKRVSAYRLLIETDAPDILPRGAPGSRNVPANLPIIMNKAAKILGEPPQTIAARTYDNGMRLFCGGRH